MRAIQYNGEVWDGPSIHASLWDLLQQKDLLIELVAGQPPYQVVVGVPHHANTGVDRIAEDWANPKTGRPGRPADETTGLAGLAVFRAIQEKWIPARLVIAAHATDHDPNKTPGSPYWQRVFERSSGPPGLLLELHGAGLQRRHALELSAGKNRPANPLLFGKILATFLRQEWIFAVQDKPGTSQASVYGNGQHTSGRLQNPALETLSLVYAGQIGIPALHLEMKGIFRQPDPDYPLAPRPGKSAWQLARALADTLEIISRSDDIHISAASLGLPSSAFLTRPTLYYKESYLSATQEAAVFGEANASPNTKRLANANPETVSATDRADFTALNDNPELRVRTSEAFLHLVEDTNQVIFDGLPEEPPEEYLWLIDQGEFIGRAFFLHWLNETRLQTDGQVDYWIRPSQRRKGYGRIILRLLLERFRQLGLKRVLISCRADNLPSRRVIEANGGVFESEIDAVDSRGNPEQRRRYWITLADA